MTPIGVQALATVLLGSAAFVHIARRSGRSELRAPLLLVIAFVMVWMGGRLVIEEAGTDPFARAGMLVSYFGACGLGPAWLFLAARFTRSPVFERQPGLLAAICMPPALAFLALLTNDGHELFGDVVGVEVLRRGPLAWGGPVFWIALGWQILLVLAGVALFVRYAAASLSAARRRHARWIATAAFLPLLTTIGAYLELLPGQMDLAPASSALAVAAIIFIAMRYRLFDSLPLARRDVIDALGDGVVLTDTDGVILDLNPAARELLGGGGRPLSDQPLARLLARLAREPEMEAAERGIDEALASGTSMSLPLKTRTGRELELRVGSVRDHEGEPSARFAVVRDLTETRRYERLLRESQQRVVVGSLAAGLAHEINNPLAFVASNLHQIHRVASFRKAELEAFEESRATELGELAEVVTETLEGVERIAATISRIIRPGGSAQDGDAPTRLDLGRVVRDAVALVDFHAKGAVATQVAPMADLPALDGRPERLSQALFILLMNAQTAAAAAPDASLRIETARDGAGVALRLRLCGPDGAPKVAAPTAAASPATTGELSAAWEAVKEHGGTLEAGGEAGTLFTMRLPAAG
jgi:PAS domain S-box-containing protein